MTARKIRETLAGLVAMPADRDENAVRADALATDPDVCTAWTEMQRLMPDDPCEDWIAALEAAADNDLRALRWHLTRAHEAALWKLVERMSAAMAAGESIDDLLAEVGTGPEDEALAMMAAEAPQEGKVA